jgi:hypothetical protein
MPIQGSLSIERMRRLSGVGRAGFYRSLQERMSVKEDILIAKVISSHWMEYPEQL